MRAIVRSTFFGSSRQIVAIEITNSRRISLGRIKATTAVPKFRKTPRATKSRAIVGFPKELSPPLGYALALLGVRSCGRIVQRLIVVR